MPIDPIDQSGVALQNRVCRLARIDVPIIQAPMTYIAGAQLAAAVSNAGALGVIETTSEQGRADLRRVRDLTDRPVGANIALLFNRDPAVVDLLVANGIRFVTTSAGSPSLFTARLQDAGITVFHVVGTLAAAQKAVDAGVDGLVVEGVEGGGFKNRFGASTMVLLPLVAAHVDVPIVAAGGNLRCQIHGRGACPRRRGRADGHAVARVGGFTGARQSQAGGRPRRRDLHRDASTRRQADDASDPDSCRREDRRLSVFRGGRSRAAACPAALLRRGHGRQRREHRPGSGAHRRPPAGRDIIESMWTGCREVLAATADRFSSGAS